MIAISKAQEYEYARTAVEESMGCGIARIKRLGGGSYGKALRVQLKNGTKLVVKLLLAPGMLDKETHDITLIGNNSPVKIPGVLFKRPLDESIPVDCYGMEHIEGKPAFKRISMLFLSRRKRLEFADKVTEYLHCIHECKNDKFGDTMSPEYDSWAEYYKPFAESVLLSAEELYVKKRLSLKVISLMREAWSHYGEIFSDEPREACLIHGDLNVGNIMVGKDNRITGFIDPLKSAYADREYDLFQFNNLTGKRYFLLETYVKKYGASTNYRQKLAFYALFNEVYCYERTGKYFRFIMNPLIKDMRRQLRNL